MLCLITPGDAGLGWKKREPGWLGWYTPGGGEAGGPSYTAWGGGGEKAGRGAGEGSAGMTTFCRGVIDDQPLGGEGVLVLGGWSPRCFSRSDLLWVEGWARKLTAEWAPVLDGVVEAFEADRSDGEPGIR